MVEVRKPLGGKGVLLYGYFSTCVIGEAIDVLCDFWPGVYGFAGESPLGAKDANSVVSSEHALEITMARWKRQTDGGKNCDG